MCVIIYLLTLSHSCLASWCRCCPSCVLSFAFTQLFPIPCDELIVLVHTCPLCTPCYLLYMCLPSQASLVHSVMLFVAVWCLPFCTSQNNPPHPPAVPTYRLSFPPSFRTWQCNNFFLGYFWGSCRIIFVDFPFSH